MLSTQKVASVLNKNPIFRFLSSIKLAIPLMLTLSVVVAWGTIVESQYNSDYSNILIYKNHWFALLLILLWINIFCATISRLPFKKHHVGFVVTHLGLLTLLAGGFVTNQFGIDGQLSIPEGQSNNTVILPNLMIGYQLEGQTNVQKVIFPKMLSPKEMAGLSDINDDIGHLVKIEKYVPFAKVNKIYQSDPTKSDDVALSFILKSPFFNVSEWLNTGSQSEMNMGPATLRLVRSESLSEEKILSNAISPRKPLVKKRLPSQQQTNEKIVIVDQTSEKEIKEIPISDLTHHEVNILGMSFRLIKKYRAAVVSSNQLTENQDPSVTNPALELQITKNQTTLREVLYAQFKNFSLNKDGVFGYRLQYLKPSDLSTSEQEPETSDTIPHQSGPENMRPGSRVIEFRVSSQDPHRAQVVLSKEGTEILRKTLNEGEKLVTPWMGIELFVGSITQNAIESSDVIEINPEKRRDLPPSAVMINGGENQKFWLLEGEQKALTVNQRNFVFYYGKELMELPFNINLKKFSKIDYPGTNTAISYESLVNINQQNETEKISMNEPLKKDGFTIYQASYVMNPSEAPISVFSVNRDPGRWLKYLGSIILSLGIILLTLTRSRLLKQSKRAI